KGTEYLLNSDLFAQAKLDIKPALKTLEPYKVQALVLEDLKYNGKSKMSEIQNRLNEIQTNDLRKAVYKLVELSDLVTFGANRNRTYEISKKK
ncbi:hypothetical protein, partial [Streptomyces lancefieldiae]